MIHTLAPDYAAVAASDALRRGHIVSVGSLAILSAELADDASLAALEAQTRADLIITARRAVVLSLANQRAAAASDPEPVRIARPAWLGLAESRGLGGFEKEPTDGWMDYYYFALITVSTVGLGDIYPTGHLRAITGIAAITGFLMISCTAQYVYKTMSQQED